MPDPVPDSAGLAAVQAWCGWHVAPSLTETVKVEGQGSRLLLLDSLRVTAITEVRNEAGDIVPSTTYKWRENGIVRGWWACEDLYSLDITHGYTNWPAELSVIINQIDADGVGSRLAASENAGPFQRSFAAPNLESQPISVRSVIARYKLPPRP